MSFFQVQVDHTAGMWTMRSPAGRSGTTRRPTWQGFLTGVTAGTANACQESGFIRISSY